MTDDIIDCPLCAVEHKRHSVPAGWQGGDCGSRYAPEGYAVYYTCSLQANHMFNHKYSHLEVEWTDAEAF